MHKLYLVTKGSDDGTFITGDHIRFLSDGAIGCIEAEGWVDKEDAKSAIKGAEYVVDPAWIARRKQKLNDQLAELEAIEQ